MQDVSLAIKNKGLRATPQRIAIYEALLPRKDHPSVEMLYNEIRSRFPSISLNTVYATLESLWHAELIQRLDVGDGRIRYDGNPRMHAHVVCTSCLRVDDLPQPSENTMLNLMRTAADVSQYRIDAGKLLFYGQCKACSADENATP
ncbi:MAG TPA: transcriptional repressor [Firmicutes bacterium]|nr:transcriptional repressor [Bacillota bacterium]